MNYLVDCDWVADDVKGTFQAVAVLDRLWEDGIAISLITDGENHDP